MAAFTIPAPFLRAFHHTRVHDCVTLCAPLFTTVRLTVLILPLPRTPPFPRDPSPPPAFRERRPPSHFGRSDRLIRATSAPLVATPLYTGGQKASPPHRLTASTGAALPACAKRAPRHGTLLPEPAEKGAAHEVDQDGHPADLHDDPR